MPRRLDPAKAAKRETALRLRHEYGWAVNEIALEIGIPRTIVRNWIAVLPPIDGRDQRLANGEPDKPRISLAALGQPSPRCWRRLLQLPECELAMVEPHWRALVEAHRKRRG